MNWIILKTNSGKISYAAMGGGELIREFEDVAVALMYEQENEFSNSLNDFLHDSKLAFEAKMRREYYKRKIEPVDSGSFRAEQRKIKKRKEREKLRKAS